MAESITITSIRDVHEFIDNQPMRQKSWIMVGIAIGTVFLDAYDFTSLGLGIIPLKQEFHLAAFQVGTITATMAFGAFAGAMFGGYVTDRIGRRTMLFVDLLLLVVAAIGAAFSTNIAMFIFFRFLMGLGVGADFPVALSFIAEFVPMRLRANTIKLQQFMWPLAASSVGFILLPFYYLGYSQSIWRIAMGASAVPALILLVARFYFAQESVLWTAHHRGLEEAAKLIEKIYGVTVAAAQRARSVRPASSYFEIFSGKYLTRTIIASTVCMTQSLEYFAVGFNVPTISKQFFGHGLYSALLGAIFFNMFNVVGIGLSIYVARYISIRKILLTGYIGVCLALAFLYRFAGVLPAEIIAIFVGLFMFSHAFGPASQSMVLATLSYPTRIRGSGSGWNQAMVRVGSISGFYLFPVLKSTIGFNATLGLIGIAPFAALIVVGLLHPGAIDDDDGEKIIV